MKNTIYIFLLISQLTSAFKGITNFYNGNKLYQNGKYQDAITEYELASNGTLQSAELYFNLGNCFYKLHKVAPAVFNFEKALQLSPNDTEIQTNLEFARKMAIDDIKVVSKVGFGKLVQDFTSSYHYNTWAWVSVIQSFAFLLLFIGYYFSRTAIKKRIFFLGMFTVILGILISIFSSLFEKNRLLNEKPAIVFAEAIEVKSEPKKLSTTAFMLHEGTKVYVIESVANWKKIQLTDETTGWVIESALKEF